MFKMVSYLNCQNNKCLLQKDKVVQMFIEEKVTIHP